MVERRLRELDLPVTLLRPMAFMELMTDRSYYPPVSTWHLMPRLMCEDRPVAWICTDDLGAIAARVFADPNRYVGRDLALATDVVTIGECRTLWQRTTGSRPRRFPMPAWLFRRFVGPDLVLMWRWLRTGEVALETDVARGILPTARTVATWLAEQRGREV